MMVHDPYEANYPDHTAHIINNIRAVSGAAYARASYDGQPLSVGVTKGDSWTVTGSASVSIPLANWVADALGVSFEVSHEYSFSSNVTAPVTSPYQYMGQSYTVHEGDETYMEEFDEYVNHYGKADTWGTSGYTGTQPYAFQAPDNPSGGYQAHLPLISSSPGGVM